MGTMWSGLNEGIPLGLEATMWSSVYLYKRLDPRHERKTGRKREVSRGSCDGSQEGVWWGHPSFSIIPSDCKVGYHTHVRQFPGYVIRRLVNHSASSGTPHLQGSLLYPFFSLGGIQALAKPFLPLLFLIQPLCHRNEKPRGG